MRDVYKKGEYNIIDDLTGFKMKSGKMRKSYKGYMVDEKGYEERSPQETLKVKSDKQWVRNSRKEVDIFLETNEVSKEDL
jgi:hypothetical protein